MPASYYAAGDWNAKCSMCGAEFKASELRKHWQGMYRCRRCWEPRHPQDFVTNVKDDPSVPWSQNPPDNVIEVCTINGASGIASLGIAECMLPDRDSPIVEPRETTL